LGFTLTAAPQLVELTSNNESLRLDRQDGIRDSFSFSDDDKVHSPAQIG